MGIFDSKNRSLLAPPLIVIYNVSALGVSATDEFQTTELSAMVEVPLFNLTVLLDEL